MEKPVKILIAEDSPEDFKLISRALQKLSLKVEWEHQESGDKVLQRIREDSDFDGIFLDLDLPGHSGSEILEFLQADQSLMTVPVYILSGLPDHQFVKSFLSKGAVGIIDKNLPSGQDLEQVVRSIQSVTCRSANHITSAPEFVVGLGASAGGLEALQEFFAKLPELTGLAFIVIQHLSPDFKSLMDQLLSGFTKMVIRPAKDDMLIERDTIYLIPSGQNMTIENGRLKLTQQDRGHGLVLPIDIFFRSLAHSWGDKSIGIILSGTGSDGSSGVLEISEHGGLILCQEPDSAKFDGMPKSAMATNVVNRVLRPGKMGEFLSFYIKNPVDPSIRARQKPDSFDLTCYGRIFSILYQRFQVGFDEYQEKTIYRRINRRMKALFLETLEDYLSRLEHDEKEQKTLYNDLLIGVTSFFRDVEAFNFLERDIIPGLFQMNASHREIRIWSAACATGQEAYSVAILLKEYSDSLKQSYDIKIFASDLNHELLNVAASGVFSESQLLGVSQARIDRFFNRRGDRYVIASEIRNMIVFAPHNLLTDPPFTKIDMIICRNFLIYIKAKVQGRVMESFHFSLKSQGILFLGPSEGLGDFEHDFIEENSTLKIFKKVHSSRVNPGNLKIARLKSHSEFQRFGHTVSPVRPFNNPAYDLILEKFVKNCLILNEDEDLIHMVGEAKKFLCFPDGKLSNNISNLIHPELKGIMTTALFKADHEKKPVSFNQIEIDINGQAELVTMIVTPLLDREGGTLKFYVLQFIDSDPDEAKPVENSVVQYQVNEYSRQMAGDLELQLRLTRQKLNSALEDSEAANEELQSTNEELLASNEELQTTNEELHSVNEELYTVNSEYQKKIEELVQLENDIDNLLQSSQMGTLFLDKELNIRKLTPAIAETFSILNHDIGRSIEIFTYKFNHPNLIFSLQEVINLGLEKVLEPKLYGDKWFVLKMIPYIVRKKISGVVITFVDVSSLKELESDIRSKDKKIAKSEQELSDFAYQSAHDLKGFLRSSQEHLDELAQMLPDEYTKKPELIKLRSDCDTLTRMADSLAKFSELGQWQPSRVIIDVNEIIDELVKRYQSDQVKMVCDEGFPNLKSDLMAFKFFMDELVRNGLQYNKSQVKKIQIGTLDSSDSECVLYVKDNGMGIPDDKHDLVFKLFRQVKAKDSEARGKGVGLCLCRRYLERLGGKIWLESELDLGTVVYISIPV